MSISDDERTKLNASFEQRLAESYEMAKASVLAGVSQDPKDTEANDGWSFYATKDRVDIFLKKVPNEPFNGCKGVGIVEAPAEVVDYMFYCPYYRKEWDGMFNSGYIVARLDRFTNIRHSCYDAPVVSGRDTCVAVRRETWEDGSTFSWSVSVEHPSCPPTRKYVRANVVYCAILCVPLENNTRCRMYYAVISDPKGYLPSSVVNYANVSQPAAIARLNTFLCKANVLSNVTATMKREYKYHYKRFDDHEAAGITFVDDSDLSEHVLIPVNDAYKPYRPQPGDEDYQEPQKASAPVPSTSSNSDKTNFISESEFMSYVSPSGLKQADYNVSLQPFEQNKYDDILTKSREAAWKAVFAEDGEDGWNFFDTKEGIKIYIRDPPPGEKVNASKGVGIVDCDPETFRSVFASSEARSKWDKMYNKGMIVEQVDTNTAISYAAFKGVFVVSPRDFCSLGRTEVLEDGTIFCYYTNSEHAEAPVAKGHVRGVLASSALYIKPIVDEDGVVRKSEVIYMIASDPNGSIPSSIVKAVNVDQPLCIAKMNDMIKSDKGAVNIAVNEAKSKFEVNVKRMYEKRMEKHNSTHILSSNVTLKQEDFSISISPLPSNPKYDTILNSAYEECWSHVLDGEDKGWTFTLEERGIKVYSKPDPSGKLKYCKGVGVINADAETIRAVFASANSRSKWDEMYDSGKVVEQIDTNTVVSYGSFKGVAFVSARDFCTLGRSIVKEDGSIFVYYTNFEHPDMPHQSKKVRGKLLFSSLYIKPIPSASSSTPRCQVIYALGNDPSGSIPDSIKNLAAIKQPLCVASIGDLIEKDPRAVDVALKEARDTWTRLNGKVCEEAPTDGTLSLNKNGEGCGGLAGTSLSQEHYSISVGPLEPSKYDNVLAEAKKMAWSSVSEDEDAGWEKQETLEGIDIYLKPVPNSDIKACKGVGVISGNAEEIRSVFAAGGTRPKWDDMYDSGKVIEQIDTNTVISYAAFKGVAFVAPRDFCSIGRSIVLDDGSIFVYYANYDHPKATVGKKCVRGTLIYSALYIQPIPNSGSPQANGGPPSAATGAKCKVVYSVCSNPSGSIPVSIINAANKMQPLCVAKIGALIHSQPQALAAAVTMEKNNWIKNTTKGDPLDVVKPGVWCVDWSSYYDSESTTPTPSTPSTSTTSTTSTSVDNWRQSLYKFNSKSGWDNVKEMYSYIRRHGLFPTPNIDNEKGMVTLVDEPIPLGKLGLQVKRIGGTYVQILKDFNVSCVINYHDTNYSTTSPSPKFSENNGVCFDVLNIMDQVTISLVAERKNNVNEKLFLGNLSLQLGELMETGYNRDEISTVHSNGSADMGRRGWFSLSNIPIEIDRAATHATLLYQNSKNKKKNDSDNENSPYNYLDDPRGLFICVESCVVLSDVNWLVAEIKQWVPSIVPSSSFATISNGFIINNATRPCQHIDNAILSPIRTNDLTVSAVANQLVNTVPSNDLNDDDIDLLSLNQTSRERTPWNTFTPELLIRNIMRLIFALQPLISVGNVMYNIFAWESVSISFFFMFVFTMLFFNPSYAPLLFVIIYLSVAVLSTANYYYNTALTAHKNNEFGRNVVARNEQITLYIKKVRDIQYSLSDHGRLAALVIQIITGHTASFLERLSSLCSWGNGTEQIIIISLYLIFLTGLNLFTSLQTSMIVGVVLLFGWNSTVITRTRFVIRAISSLYLVKGVLHQQSQSIRLIGLKKNQHKTTGKL